jgi:hypothetical protein
MEALDVGTGASHGPALSDPAAAGRTVTRVYDVQPRRVLPEVI